MIEFCYEPSKQSDAVVVRSDDHTMGESLAQYLKMKIHPLLLRSNPDRVDVVPMHNRTEGVSELEKEGKLFNFKRPTAVMSSTNQIELRCFPGFDYVFHYAGIVASHYQSLGHPLRVTYTTPEKSLCRRALEASGIFKIPLARVVIMGYVEGLDSRSPDDKWRGEGEFKWKRFDSTIPDSILVGCEHTYWGDIAGTVVELLAERGVQLVIYAGKLGSLNSTDVPNTCLASSAESVLPDGHAVVWENIFEHTKFDDDLCRYGMHVTVPSVLQETKQWLESLDSRMRFVDPEIGHMAAAAKLAGIGFSNLHIISDNLVAQHEHDLSNERDSEVVEKRSMLTTRMTDAIWASIR